VDLVQRRTQLAIHQRTLHEFAQYVTRNAEAAREVLQDAAVVILQHPAGPEDGEHFEAWCRAVVRHLDLHRRRDFGRRAVYERPDGVVDDEVERPSPDPLHDPERAFGAKEMLAALVEGLDERSLCFLGDRYVLEKTPQEIATSLGVTSASVRMRLTRLVTSLRK
jgi:RNA polymerase sigma factor (sigma-70 family)